MRVTLLYDNTSARQDLEPDWGFSCLVEVEARPPILFDTGARGDILLHNMERLGVDTSSIRGIFISHDHWDHTGGLNAFLGASASGIRLFVPKNFSGRPDVEDIKVIDRPTEIMDGIFTTGELAGIEQSMVVKTPEGLVVIVGCSHPGVEAILNAASTFGRPYALIGGLHGFNKFEVLSGLSLICPCHCTQHQKEIFSLYPDVSIQGGAGRVISI
ncbi:MAG: MBL fold metallo-hydrolase [Deltaproteobacteria bacterium]|nr:MAG: MBL fold metallo-hydrolase [Deltaproteobacteria bacterium]